MKKRLKRFFLLTAACGLFASVPVYAKDVVMNLHYYGKDHAYKAKEVKIEIDGEELVPKDMPAVIIEERTMLPMRLIAQALGCEVTWNEQAKQVYVINDDYTLVFTIGSNIGYQNGIPFPIDVPALIVNDRTMLPVRALAKALELDITWDHASRTVSIETDGTAEEPDKEDVKEEPKEEQKQEPAKPVEMPTAPSTPTIQPTTPAKQNITLNQLIVPSAKTAGQVFTIQANGAITGMEEILVEGNKIVLDFHGARSGLATNTTTTNSNIVSAVRTAQHTDENGDIYTRVVLDLTTKKRYEVTQSGDKTKVYISFDKVTVDDVKIKHNSNTEKDMIEIEGDGALTPNVFTLSNPNRVVIDIPNAISELEEVLDVSALESVTAARTGMFTETTLRIVLEVEELTQYTYTTDSDSMTLQLFRSKMGAIQYDAANNVLYMDKDEEIDIYKIQENDQYLNGYYEITLPGDYESVYGYGTYELGDDLVQSIKVSAVNEKTVLRFNQNQINAYQMKDLGDKYAIYVKPPKAVYDKVLLLDAGHGGSDPGASGNGLTEKTVNLSVMQKIVKELEGSDIKVYVTRNSDVYPANNDRAKMANQIAHAMVSIHMNSAAAVANGTEVLYKNHANDTTGLTSKLLAEVIQNSIIEATDNTDRGTKHRTDLLILNATTVPAVIVEVGFLSNPADALKLSQNDYQQTVAVAIAEAIVSAMNLL